jgi:hypothetical protein
MAKTQLTSDQVSTPFLGSFTQQNATDGTDGILLKNAAGTTIATLMVSASGVTINSVSGKVVLANGGVERAQVNGNVGINTAASGASARLSVGEVGSTGATLNDTVWLQGYSSTAQLRYIFNHAGAGQGLGVGSDGVGALIFGRTNTGSTGAVAAEFGRFDSNGYLLVGTTSSATYHRLSKAAVNDGGNAVLDVSGATGVSTLFYAVSGTGANSANTAFKTGKDGTTSRSINAAGTVNASGADYAEYMTKAEGCATLAKGQIVGVDANGRLTDKWAASVSFLVKSTSPSYVGGDVWGSEQVLGITRPVEPHLQLPAYTGSEKPADLAEGEASTAERDAALAQYEADLVAYATACEDVQAAYDAALAAYQEDLATFNAALEAARQKVDRIAYCGQVPVNITGAVPGQYVVPVQDGDGIGAVLVNDADITFAQYRRAVGIVQNILEDDRANVRVKLV